jgi:hypothetical protein
MKYRNYLAAVIGMLFIVCVIGCSNDDSTDKVETITMTVSSETGVTFDWSDSEGKYPMECMKVKSGASTNDWETLNFGEIENFEYEKGYEYVLRVQRTTLANPPADGSMYTYKLIKIISSKCIVEYPKDSAIDNESEIEYEEGCPDHFYDIWNNVITVDNDGNLSHNKQEGNSKWLSYEKAVIYTEYVLPRTDARWSKIKFMPTKAYIVSPFSNKIKCVTMSNCDIWFKEVVPAEDFQKIKSDVKAGESVSYYLILTNAWQKAIQKIELKIKR